MFADQLADTRLIVNDQDLSPVSYTHLLSLRSVCMLCALGAAVAARWMGARTLTRCV